MSLKSTLQAVTAERDRLTKHIEAFQTENASLHGAWRIRRISTHSYNPERIRGLLDREHAMSLLTANSKTGSQGAPAQQLHVMLDGQCRAL